MFSPAVSRHSLPGALRQCWYSAVEKLMMTHGAMLTSNLYTQAPDASLHAPLRYSQAFVPLTYEDWTARQDKKNLASHYLRHGLGIKHDNAAGRNFLGWYETFALPSIGHCLARLRRL